MEQINLLIQMTDNTIIIIPPKNQDPQDYKQIIGKWYPINRLSKDYYYIEFETNNSFKYVKTFKTKEYIYLGTYSIDKDRLIISNGQKIIISKFEINDRILTITSQQDTDKGGILEMEYYRKK